MSSLITLGPHNIDTATSHAVEWRGHAAIVKQVDSTNLLKEAPESAIRIYRKFFANQDLMANPQNIANAIIAGLEGYRHPNLYVEVYNEIGKGGLSNYILLLKGVVKFLHAAGIKVCGPCWSTGDYASFDWLAFRQNKWCGLDAIALHGYWGNQGFTLDHALRYRQFWSPTAGDPKLLFVTECGRDIVEGGQRGWKKDGISPSAYVSELTAYSQEIAKDGVLGVVFQEGSSDPQWDAFDTSGLDLSALYANGGIIVPPTEIVVGAGFQKCIPYIGNFLESEIYHGAGMYRETSLALAERGYAAWRKITNETICVTDDGRIYSDFGNNGTGVLVRVH